MSKRMNLFKATVFLLPLVILLSCSASTRSGSVCMNPARESLRLIEFIDTLSSTLSEAISETRKSIQIAKDEAETLTVLVKNLNELEKVLVELQLANNELLNSSYTNENLGVFENTSSKLLVYRQLISKQLIGLSREELALSMTLQSINELVEFVESSTSELNKTIGEVVWEQENS